MQSAQVAVGEQRRGLQGDQQAPDQRPTEADVLAISTGDHDQPEGVLTWGEAEEPNRSRADHQPDDHHGGG